MECEWKRVVEEFFGDKTCVASKQENATGNVGSDTRGIGQQSEHTGRDFSRVGSHAEMDIAADVLLQISQKEKTPAKPTPTGRDPRNVRNTRSNVRRVLSVGD